MLAGDELSVQELCEERPELVPELREAIDRFKGTWVERN